MLANKVATKQSAQVEKVKLAMIKRFRNKNK